MATWRVWLDRRGVLENDEEQNLACVVPWDLLRAMVIFRSSYMCSKKNQYSVCIWMQPRRAL